MVHFIFKPYPIQFHPPGTKCYQCAYSPGKVVYETVTYKERAVDGYGNPYYATRSRSVAKDTPGGWVPCKGPFSDYEAKHYGIDTWECYDNCFTRIDKNDSKLRLD